MYDPSGELVATGSMDGTVRLWRAADGQAAGVLQGPSEAIEFMAWHPKGTVLLVGSEDMHAWMFHAVQQQCMQVFSGHSGPVAAGVLPSRGFGLACTVTIQVVYLVHVAFSVLLYSRCVYMHQNLQYEAAQPDL
jgi:WD40 repeat protein